jgi:PhnB protein
MKIMTTVNAYLSFNGNCEAAFNIYKSVFGNEFSFIGRYKDMPSSDQPIPESEYNKIMHIGLPIGQGTALYGADMTEAFAQATVMGNNFALTVNTESEAEARRVFNALSAGGKVSMPLEKTFWSALFGMFTDKFNVNWMVSYDYSPDEK